MQDSPEEPVCRFGQSLPALGLAILIAKGHLFTVVGNDVLLPEHAAIKVACQIY